ncbi:hypothetical protein O0466_000451 [Salmonella enterica]|nr:hypothetical protein [Salmonella enterica]HAU2961119.1 hypothetical protein [Salmonella enterica subsp. diarizonae]HCM1893438.1 hypothetical protein [Salmonella enterica subsp. diarizonae serovar 57:c:e,n,x,z15]EAY1317951.1 hypothetical protein [Salmonella enterica]EGQ5164908.1 hypothetical protein [Salmonella enterica]
MELTKVRDQLPQTSGDFIVTTKNGVGMARYNQLEGFHNIHLAGMVQCHPDTVTQWMPFPDNQKHADFLASLSEEKIQQDIEAGDKCSCILFTNIVYSLIKIGAGYDASGVTLAYGRRYSSEFTDKEIVQMVMGIVRNSLKNWERNL